MLLVLFDRKLQLTVQVCCLFYYLLHSRFFKGKVKCEFLMGFTVFLSGLLKKSGCFFWLGPITSTLIDIRVWF